MTDEKKMNDENLHGFVDVSFYVKNVDDADKNVDDTVDSTDKSVDDADKNVDDADKNVDDTVDDTVKSVDDMVEFDCGEFGVKSWEEIVESIRKVGEFSSTRKYGPIVDDVAGVILHPPNCVPQLSPVV